MSQVLSELSVQSCFLATRDNLIELPLSARHQLYTRTATHNLGQKFQFFKKNLNCFAIRKAVTQFTFAYSEVTRFLEI